MKSHVLVQTTHRQQPKSQHEQIYKRRFMKVPMLISLAAAPLFTSRGFAAPYEDIAAKGYRWANTNGLVACLSKDDLREIIKQQTDETGLQMIEQLRAYCTSPDKTDTEIWLTNAVCYRSECCTAFKVASRHKRQLPTGYPPFIPFALLNYVTHSEKG